MKLLDRYIIKELMPPFFYSLAVIIFVLVLDFILKILNFIIAKGVPIIVVGKLFTFSLAPLMALAVPMASLMASLMAFGRLSEDKEIVALNALGVPFWRIMYPGFVFMILLSGVMLMFNISVVPEANFAVKKIFYQIHRKKPMAVLKARVFIDDFPGITLYIDRIDDKRGKIYGVNIWEKQKGKKPRTIIAPEGEVRYVPEEDAIQFTLYNGEIHEVDPKDPMKYTVMEFTQQIIKITDLGTKLGGAENTRRGDRELTLGMISKKIAEHKGNIEKSRNEIRKIVNSAVDSLFVPREYESSSKRSAVHRALLRERRRYMQIRKHKYRIFSSFRRLNKLKSEYHKKFVLALACLMFFLVGAPVGAWARRGGLGVAVGLSFGFFLIYWAFLIGGEELSVRGIIPPELGMWSGNIFLLFVFVAMLYRVTFEARFSGTGWLARIVERFYKKQNPAQ